MNNRLALSLQTKIHGIPFDVQVEALPLSSDTIRILQSSMAGSQAMDLSIDDLRSLHSLLSRALSAAENLR